MQPWENGHVYRESDLTSDTTGETQFERRMYDMRFLKHDDIAAIRRALAADGNADALIVLSKTPELPE